MNLHAVTDAHSVARASAPGILGRYDGWYFLAECAARRVETIPTGLRNQQVVGSSPTAGSKQVKHLRGWPSEAISPKLLHSYQPAEKPRGCPATRRSARPTMRESPPTIAPHSGDDGLRLPVPFCTPEPSASQRTGCLRKQFFGDTRAWQVGTSNAASPSNYLARVSDQCYRLLRLPYRVVPPLFVHGEADRFFDLGDRASAEIGDGRAQTRRYRPFRISRCEDPRGSLPSHCTPQSLNSA